MKIKRNLSREKEWLFNDGSLPIQVKIVEPGDINSVEHYHKTMHEYFFLLQGRARISVNGTVHALERDDVLIVEPGEIHRVIDYSADMRLLLLMPPPVPGDKYVVSF